MSGLKAITVNTDPAAEAHIYAEDDAAICQSIVGSDGVMSIGQQCASQVISNNKVRIKDGVLVVGGHFARIPYGDYIDCEIANGQSGRNRNDIIVAKFVTTGSGGIDTYTCEVKQGSSTTGTATDPALTQNDLYQSGKIREMPLYRVKIEGLSIVKVEQMFDLIPTIPTLNADLAELLTFEEEELVEGVVITRCGRHRVLQLSNASSQTPGDIVRLPEADMPSAYVMGSATYRGQTEGDYFLSITPKTGSPAGKVGLFRGNNTAVSVNGNYIVAHIDWYV